MLKRKIYNQLLISLLQLQTHLYLPYRGKCRCVLSYLFAVLICAVNFESYTVFFVSNMIFYLYDLLFMGWQDAPKIIPLTRKVQLLTRKGKQLTRKVGVNFYGFIFLLQRIILGNFGTKNVLPIRRKHYRLAALLHDVFRKPHRQKVYLKPK